MQTKGKAGIIAISVFLFTLLLGCVFPAAHATASKSDEANRESFFDKGQSEFKARNLDAAIDAFLQSIYFARNDYNPEAYFWLGKSYMAAHEDAKAIEAFNKHVEQNMGYSHEGHLYLGEIYLRNERLKDAEAEAGKVMETADGEDEQKAHNLFGKILVAKGDYFDAQSEFRLALGTAPWKFLEAWMNYAESLMKQGKWAEACLQYHDILSASDRIEHVDAAKCKANIALCKAGMIKEFDSLRPQLRDSYVPNIIDSEMQILPAQILPCETQYKKAGEGIIPWAHPPVAIFGRPASYAPKRYTNSRDPFPILHNPGWKLRKQPSASKP